MPGPSPSPKTRAGDVYSPQEGSSRVADGEELVRAVEANDVQTVRRLVGAGYSTDVYRSIETRATVLHLAASLASPECLVEILRQQNKPRFLSDSNGDTPLHCASRWTRSITSVLLLVSIYGADVTQNRPMGNTFFHCLMGNSFLGESDILELIKWLFDRNDFAANGLLNIVNAEGSTAYDVASKFHRGHVDLLECLLHNGASSGSMLRSSEIAALISAEYEPRGAIDSEERTARDTIARCFARHTQKLRKAEARVEKSLLKEQEGRERIVRKEGGCWSSLLDRWGRGASRIAERTVRRRFNAVLVLQSVGRAYLSRRATAHLAAPPCLASSPTVDDDVSAEQLALPEDDIAQHGTLRGRDDATVDTATTRLSLPPVSSSAASHALPLADSDSGGITWAPPLAVSASSSPSSTTPSTPAVNANPPPSATGGSAKHVPPLTPIEQMAKRIWRAYTQYRVRRMNQAAIVLQAHFRGYRIRLSYLIVREACITLQRWWRRLQRRRLHEQRAATDAILAALRNLDFIVHGQLFIADATAARQRERIRGICQGVTQLVWRENFCSAFREIVFRRKRQKPPPPPPNFRWQRWRKLTTKMEPFVLLAQVSISLFLLIYMGCIPRTRKTRVHNKVDLAFICIQFVLCGLYPLSWWHIADVAVIVTALVCAATETYGGVVVITLLLLKIPLLVLAMAPNHSGTRTYCRAVSYTVMYLFAMSPFALAGVGATVRGACQNELLQTAHGNWGRVLLYLWSSLSPQYAFQAVVVNGKGFTVNSSFPVFNVAATVNWHVIHGATASPTDTVEVVDIRMPIVQVVFFYVVLYLYTWASTVVGTHSAIRSHYDISDETKLMTNKHRFRNASKVELLDAHRAANIEALGQQLDGVMWEADVRAAKEAVDASHYDHNANHTVHRFVRRVQDSVAQGNLKLEERLRRGGDKPKGTTRAQHFGGGEVVAPDVEETKWDCRNEDPRSRGRYDIEVIEAALGMQERKGFGERFFERQWTGGVFDRETTVLLVAMMIMAAVRPNLLPMEIAFSSVLALELVLSLYFLRIDFICSHYWRLTVRVFGVIVGYIPSALPYVAFRGLRLAEGWSSIFMLPGMVRWGLAYALVTFAAIWMVAFVASLQHYKAALEEGDAVVGLTGNATVGNGTAAAPPLICSGTANCLAISLRELVIPAWTPEHIRPSTEAPLMATMVVAVQLFFIPFVLTIALHPLLQLSNFIGRFLRLVVQSLHKDVLDYLDSYLEGEPWFSHWRIKVPISANVITKLKIWAYDSYRRNISFEGSRSRSNSVSTVLLFPQATFVDAFLDARRTTANRSSLAEVVDEIVCKSQFASLEENEALDDSAQRLRCRLLRRLTRRPVLHYANMAATFASIAFLWISDTTYSRGHAVTILAIIFHFLSIVTSVIVFPKDVTAALTFLGSASLLVAVVMILLPGRAFHEYYCVRYISLLRLGQLQVFPFTTVKRFLKTFLYSAIKVVFPVIVVGALAYGAELLRAQIFLVTKSLDFDNATFDSNASWVWQPANLSFPDTLLLSRCAPEVMPHGNMSIPANDTYEVHCRKTRQPDTVETMYLFGYYFSEDAYIYYSIFSYWLLPALCVSSCLAYLFWSGANLLDTRRLTIKLIPLLEDPVTLAKFRPNIWHFRLVGNIVLLVSIAFGCVFSPSTGATADDLKLFFGFEVGFTAVGLAESVLGVAFAVHRSGCSWVNWRYRDEKEDNVLYVAGDCFLLLCEAVGLLYYTIALPMCATLLSERRECFIAPEAYATYFITLRFVFVLRLLPRQYILAFGKDVAVFAYAVASIFIYLIGCTSALADLAAASAGTHVSPGLWSHAFGDLIRHTFTSASPRTFQSNWYGPNMTEVALHLLSRGGEPLYVDTDFSSSRLLFILATIGKAVLASAVGVGTAIALVPLRAHAVYPLPKKSALLYDTLSGGLGAILRYGTNNHDDMRPEARRKAQSRKFARIFTEKGIPSWALPHLLEELNICRPARQRRFMFSLRQLLVYLPISEKRQQMVREYMDIWDAYRNGAPSRLRFTALPVYPPMIDTNIGSDGKRGGDNDGSGRRSGSGSPSQLTMDTASLRVGGQPRAGRRHTSPTAAAGHAKRGSAVSNPLLAKPLPATRQSPRSNGQPAKTPPASVIAPHNQFIAPLRLVQALAFFELGFPADSSMGSKLWLDFFSVVQKVRAATLLQSLWRMYRHEKEFDADKTRTFQEKMTIATLRRSFRKYRIKGNATFRCYETFSDALLFDHEVFNPGTGHHDLLNRLRGHYSVLSPTAKFVLKEQVGHDILDAPANTNSVSQYVSHYLQQSSRRRLGVSTSISPTRGGPARDFLMSERADENSFSMQSTQAKHTSTRHPRGS